MLAGNVIIYLTPGTGKWDVNGRTLGDYFPRPSLVQHIQQSFTATDTGNGAVLANARTRRIVPSVEPSSCTTSSSGRRVWDARESSMGPSHRSPW